MRLLTSVDGTCFPPGQATVPADDDGLRRGDGAFEMVRIYSGKPFALADHVDRIERSCAAIDLACPRASVEEEIAALFAEAEPDDCLMRMVLTRGGRRILSLEPLIDHPAAITLFPVPYAPSVILNGVKSLSYAANMHATRIAVREGFDEALLMTPDGTVLEAPTSTIFWAAGGHIRTPALDTGILASITRDRLLAELDVEEGAFPLDDLDSADEAFLASTTREVQPVARVADQQFTTPGPLTLDAAEAMRQVIERELAAGA